jgi:hypothetical protein
MNYRQTNVFFGGIAVLILVVILAFWNYKINENTLMSKNINEAMTKGIDPLSVRCTYAADTDNICLAYALKNHDRNTDIPVPIRK